MPDTPNFAITYPCEGVAINCADFATFVNDVEAAFVTVDAEVTAVAEVPYAFANLTVNPAFAVETAMTMSNTASSGVTVGATTFTIVTAGLYAASVKLDSANSTLTITSNRVAIAVNGTNVVNCKWRGHNPADALVMFGGYSTDLSLAVGDTVSYRYLWTGTGALTGPMSGVGSITLLAKP